MAQKEVLIGWTINGLTHHYHKGALLLNEGIPRALKGKKLCLKNILLLPLIFEEMNSF